MTKIDRSEFIQKPNKKLINSYINRFEKNNSIDESALRKVFKDYDNSSCENILIKLAFK